MPYAREELLALVFEEIHGCGMVVDPARPHTNRGDSTAPGGTPLPVPASRSDAKLLLVATGAVVARRAARRRGAAPRDRPGVEPDQVPAVRRRRRRRRSSSELKDGGPYFFPDPFGGEPQHPPRARGRQGRGALRHPARARRTAGCGGGARSTRSSTATTTSCRAPTSPATATEIGLGRRQQGRAARSTCGTGKPRRRGVDRSGARSSPAAPRRAADASRPRRGSARPPRSCRRRRPARGSRPRRTCRGSTSSPTRRPMPSAPRAPVGPLRGRRRRTHRRVGHRLAVLHRVAPARRRPSAPLGTRAEHVHQLLGDLGRGSGSAGSSRWRRTASGSTRGTGTAAPAPG